MKIYLIQNSHLGTVVDVLADHARALRMLDVLGPDYQIVPFTVDVARG